MVVCGKDTLAFDAAVQVFRYSPGKGQAVEGAGSPADLVQKNQAVFRGGSENGGNLRHLNHECALAAREVVVCSNPGEDAVDDGERSKSGRHKRSCLSHDGRERYLAHEGGLSGHIRAGEDDEPVMISVQENIVGDIAPSHGFVQDGMLVAA